MSDPVDRQVDRMLDEVLLATSAYVDLDEAREAIREGLQAVRKQLTALNAAKYGKRKVRARCPSCAKRVEFMAPPSADELARAASHTMKVVDQAARLASFAKGLPDSRPGGADSNRDLLSMLTPEQLAVFEGWVTMAQARLQG